MPVATDAPPRDAFGSGLPVGALLAVLSLSVALFLFYEGPLWSAPPGASHVGRIVVSYLAVLPLVATALLFLRSFSVARALTAVAIVWAAKLLITSSLYLLIAPGTAHEYAPARPWENSPSGTSAGATRADPKGPPSPVAPPTDIEITLRDGHTERPEYVVGTAHRLIVRNADRVLHTLELVRASGGAVANVPLPPGGEPRALTPPTPGVYDITCAAHPNERATVIVVDEASNEEAP